MCELTASNVHNTSARSTSAPAAVTKERVLELDADAELIVEEDVDGVLVTTKLERGIAGLQAFSSS